MESPPLPPHPPLVFYSSFALENLSHAHRLTADESMYFILKYTWKCVVPTAFSSNLTVFFFTFIMIKMSA